MRRFWAPLVLVAVAFLGAILVVGESEVPRLFVSSVFVLVVLIAGRRLAEWSVNRQHRPTDHS